MDDLDSIDADLRQLKPAPTQLSTRAKIFRLAPAITAARASKVPWKAIADRLRSKHGIIIETALLQNYTYQARKEQEDKESIGLTPDDPPIRESKKVTRKSTAASSFKGKADTGRKTKLMEQDLVD